MDIPPQTLATRSTLLTLGVSSEALTARVASRSWWRLTYSWYWTSPDAPPPFAQATVVSLATCAVAGVPPVISHHLAAHCHRLPGAPRAVDWHAVLPPGASRPSRGRLHMHRYELPADDVQTHRAWPRLLTPEGVAPSPPLRLTTPARTLTDLFQCLDEVDALWMAEACSAANRVSLPALQARLTRRKDQHRLALADANSASALETAVRVLLVKAGLAPEELNVALAGPGGAIVAEGDLVWHQRRLVLFCDGWTTHARRRSVIADRAQAKALESMGWTVIRVTWEDLQQRPEWVLREVRVALGRLAA